MKPTMFRGRVDEYNECLTQIGELFSNFRYKHFHHSSSYYILLNILENVLHSVEIWMLEWMFMIQLADMEICLIF
jgi:hypothetical protein